MDQSPRWSASETFVGLILSPARKSGHPQLEGKMMKGQKGYVLVVKTLSHDNALERVWHAAMAQIARWRKLHRERAVLGSLSDDALKDIGLSRADVYQESERRFWDDPMKH
jgi:uncharacterized protein YjiS (DUF1127 family)